MTDLENILKAFVIGATATRDESHNHVHMTRVYNSSMLIFASLCKQGNCSDDKRVQNLITAVSLLHDVSDHKYDPDGMYKNSMKLILYDFFCEDEIELVMNIIDRISFSREDKAKQKGESSDWDEVLGVIGCLVRNIVSDADKIEAIGLVGVERCMMYSKHKRASKNESVVDKLIVEDLIKHCEEKLFRLKDEFMRTIPGKELAEPFHNEMVNKVKELAAEHSIELNM